MHEKISMFIDDELKLAEKILFLEEIKTNPSVADEAIEFLHLEKKIRMDVVEHMPQIELLQTSILRHIGHFFKQPLGWTVAALAAALIAMFITTMQPVGPFLKETRFVIYKPEASQVEITGSFTGWKRISMQRAGYSGYWELTLPLPEGEHRFTYILEGRKPFTDPTIPVYERDDFGGQNSVLFVEKRV